MALNPYYSKEGYTVTNINVLDYTFKFKIYNDSDIVVFKRGQNDVINDTNNILILNTDYTVTIDGDNGGYISLINNPTLADIVTITRVLPIDRTVNYTPNGGIYSSDLNGDQDFQTYLIQDQLGTSDSYISIPSSTLTSDVDTKIDTLYDGGVIKVSSDGTKIECDATLGAEFTEVADSIDNVNIVGNNMEDVNVVSWDIGNVDRVANNIDNVNQVGLNITDVISNSTNMGNIISVDNNSTNINDVAASIGDISSVASNLPNINNVSTNMGVISSVDASLTTIQTVNNNITTIVNVNDNEANINAVNANEANINAVNAKETLMNDVLTALPTMTQAIADVDTFNGTYYANLPLSPTITTHPTLSVGDMYFNTSDNKLKVYDNNNEWIDMAITQVTLAGTPFDLVETNFIATEGQTVFNVNYNTLNNVLVYVNGFLLKSTDINSLSGTSITITPTNQNDIIKIQEIGITASTFTEFVATAGQTVFTVPSNLGVFEVFYNGYTISQSDYTTTPTTITFNSGIPAGSDISVLGLVSTIPPTSVELVTTAGQTSFNIDYIAETAILLVTLNGRLLESSDYDSTSGSFVILNTPTNAGDIVLIYNLPADPGVLIEAPYSKAETDRLIDSIGIDNIYTKAEQDLLLADKADIGISYTKSEIDSQKNGTVQTVSYENNYEYSFSTQTGVSAQIPHMSISFTPLYDNSKIKITIQFIASCDSLNKTAPGYGFNITGGNFSSPLLGTMFTADLGGNVLETINLNYVFEQPSTAGTPIDFYLWMHQSDNASVGDETIYVNKDMSGNFQTSSFIIIEEII